MAQDDNRKIQAQLKRNQVAARIEELEGKNQELEARLKGVELGKIVVGNPEDSYVSAAQAAPLSQQAGQQAATRAASGVALAKETTAPAAPQSGEGKVLVVNREYNFIVINLGSKDGVNVGKIYSVYHNNKYVGDVKIDKVHDSMAAAGFISADVKDKISEGDKLVPNPQRYSPLFV